jgi:ABC-type histidine transport system ATPase subunit
VSDAAIALQVEDLYKSFGSLEVIKGMSLTARNHEVISIIGSSGSGKSTFLRCLNFLERALSPQLHKDRDARRAGKAQLAAN